MPEPLPHAEAPSPSEALPGAPSPGGAGPRDSSRAPALLFILATMLLDVMGIGISIPVMPDLVAQVAHTDLSGASTHVGTMAALYTGMMFLCAPLLGALSDRFGRKPVLLGALAVSTLSYGLTAIAPSLGWLLAARALGGIGGASLTVAQTYIADVSSPEDRAKNFGLSGAAFGVGFIVGPAVGGLLGLWGLRVPFLAAAAVTFLNLAYGAFVVPESHAREHRRAFRWAEANPMGWVVTLREHPAVLRLTGTLVWIWLGQQALQSTWVLYTSYRYHWGSGQNGASLAVVGILTAIVQGWLIRPLLPRLGERRAIVWGLGLNALALVGYGLAPRGWMIYLILIPGCLGGISGPALQGLISRQVGPDRQGAVQGALTSLMSLTGIFGPLLANNLFAYFTGPSSPMVLPGIAFFLGAFCCGVGLLSIMRVFGEKGEHAIRLIPAEAGVGESMAMAGGGAPTSMGAGRGFPPGSEGPADAPPMR